MQLLQIAACDLQESLVVVAQRLGGQRLKGLGQPLLRPVDERELLLAALSLVLELLREPGIGALELPQLVLELRPEPPSLC